jgi:hypothetical protein
MADLNEWLNRIETGEASPSLKAMASKGLVPFEPLAMVRALAILAGDASEEVSGQSRDTSTTLPRGLILAVAGDREAGPVAMRHLARTFPDDEEVLCLIAANPGAPDDTLEGLSTSSMTSVLEALARNQKRLRASYDLLMRLIQNPDLPTRLKGFLIEERDRQRAKEKVILEETTAEDLPTEIVFDKVVIEEFEEEVASLPPQKRDEVLDQRRKSIFQIIRTLNVPEKIVLALKGNREARYLLIRDSNKMVAGKVLESPRLSDTEIEMFAKMTNVSDDVLRGISLKKEWMGKYNIMKALVMNAKCPMGITLPLVGRLTVRDLGLLGKNRNVPETIRQTAAKLFRMRREMRSGAAGKQ